MDKNIIYELDELEKKLNKTLIGFSRSVGVMIELELMKTANEERRSKGLADAYGDDAFAVLVDTQSSIVADMVE